MSFATRLFLGAVSVLVITVGVSSWATDRWLRRDLERSFTDEVARQTRLIAGTVPQDEDSLNAVARRFGTLVGRRVTFISEDGVVLGDSEFDDRSLRLLDNHRDRPEVAQALAGETGVARRLSASTNREELKVALRAWPGIVRVSAPLEQINATIGAAQRTVYIAAVVALLFGSLLAVVGGRTTTRPLAELGQAARALAAGQAPAYPTSSAPEIRQLVQALRGMSEELGTRIAELRREREETQALVESMVEGVVAVNANGDVVACNSATRRLLGFGPEDSIPNLRELFQEREARSIVDGVLAGESILGQEADVRGRTILFTARPLPRGGAVVVLHDVTDQRQLEVVRRDFVANVSHELKTPLTNISGYTETIISDEPDADTRAKFLRVIGENANRMQHIIDDLLDLARVESGRWQPAPHPVDLGRVSEEAWSQVAESTKKGAVEFVLSVPADLSVFADPEALRQILTNLFDNAVRHTPAGGKLELHAAASPAGTEIRVSDTGSGIPSDQLDRIFERFYRVDPSRSREDGGTGLGLAIVKHLAEAHGGWVSAESAVGRGTTFRIFLPAAPAA